ncbi:MAG: polysaccharide pyruvyl transferase CsaB [Bacillota bacterium]|nr:polysaccharide pyruvyl transferase CsaB [Bacillota bacterium]
MRIMLLAGGGDIGGGKTHILSLAKELSKTNDVLLLSFRKGSFADDSIAMGINTVVVDHKKGILRAIKEAEAQINEFAPQLVHCHGSKANMIGTILKAKTGIPVITTVHSDPKLDYMGKPFRKYTFGLINQIALRKMDAHVAVASEMKNLLIKRDFDPFNIFTIFNGIDFTGSEKITKTKNEEDTINVGIAARFNPVKDIETIIKAFALAYSQNNKLRLFIAGNGEEEQKLRQLVKQFDIESVVSFEGWQSDVKAFFEKIDINVLSSLSETFPYSLLEGAYMHCPAIASNAGGIPYLIKHEKTGLLFECKDIETFALYILKLANDKELRNKLADNLYAFAKENFSLENMAKTQEKIYESVLQRRNNSDRYGLVICGAYGRGNAGDEAILKSIISEVRSVDENIPVWVMSRNPKETQLWHQERSIYIFNPLTFIAALKKSKVFLSGGGSLIQDVTSSRSLMFYLYTLAVAKRNDCRVLMYGCGVGPITKKKHEKIVADTINDNVDVITLRDSMSLKLLRTIGVDKPNIIVSADPAFGLCPAADEDIKAAFASEQIPEGIKMMGLCLREWRTFIHLEDVAKAADYGYRKYGLVPIFMSIEPKDIHIAKSVAGYLSKETPRYICNKPHHDSEMIGMLSRMDVVCGMRLHSLIFATASGTPTFALSYDVKDDGFYKDIGNNAIVSVDKIEADILKEFIDDAVLGSKFQSRLISEKFRAIEQKNVVVLSELIKA